MLDLSHQNLTQIPDIPDDTTHLDISHNQIQIIDKLPPNLVYLNCSFNQIKSLPSLPKTIEYLNISNNQFSKKPRVSKNLDFFDENNLYNLYGSSMQAYCFDFDLFSKVDLDFYFISSKDNLVLKFRNKYLCYNRQDLKFIKKSNRLYEIDDSLFEGIQINESDKNQLKSRRYSLYNILEGSGIAEVIPYKREEFLSI
jgi:Leucine-rich repeat (LRR) protein